MSEVLKREAVSSLVSLYGRGDAERRAGEPAWVGRMRDEALAAFEAQGIPTRRLEAWKGTSLAALEKMRFSASGRAPTSSIPAAEGTGPELVFVDGVFAPERSRLERMPEGCRLLSLARVRRERPELLEGRLGSLADPKRHALIALQTAFLDDGAVVVVEPGTSIPEPIRLRFVSTGADRNAPVAAFPRLLVVLGEGSETRLFQEHDSEGPAAGLTALVGELRLAAGARLELVQVQHEAAARIHFTGLHASLERDARLESHVFSLGSGLTRSELAVQLVEPGAEARLRGFFLGRDDGHVDHYTTVDHVADHCTSDQEYRGVLGDRSQGVFRGRVIVRPGAQKTDARQSNPNLLVSERASVDSKPQLEIYADDVRASHGSTIGQLDPDALFFLRARGIALADARLLLTRAFARVILDGVGEESVRQHVAARLEESLAALEHSTSGSEEGGRR